VEVKDERFARGMPDVCLAGEFILALTAGLIVIKRAALDGAGEAG
jgi:hypothetical protein